MPEEVPTPDDTPITMGTMRGMMKETLDAYAAGRKEDTGIKSIKQLQQEAKSSVELVLEQTLKSARRSKIVSWVFGVLATGGVVSFAGYEIAIKKPPPEPGVGAAEVEATVKTEGKAIDTRVETVEKKVERLGDIAVDQQIQTSDGIKYIGEKIDAAHPRQKDKVAKPATLREAEVRAKSAKEKKRRKELDPFQGLELPSPPPRPPS